MRNTKPEQTDTISENDVLPLSGLEGVKAFVDLAFTTEDRRLVIVGWIFDPHSRIQGMSLLQAGARGQFERLPIESGVDGMVLVRVSRIDVTMAMRGTAKVRSDMHGFIGVIPFAPDNAQLALEAVDGKHFLVPYEAFKTVYESVRGLKQLSGISHDTLLAALRIGLGNDNPIYALFSDSPNTPSISPLDSSPINRTDLLQSNKLYNSVVRNFDELPVLIERPETLVGCVDHCYTLGNAGLLFYGWFFFPKRSPKSIFICDEAGDRTYIDEQICRLPRQDVLNAYRDRFSSLDTMCGFVAFANIPTISGEPRALCFDFGYHGEVWLKLPSEKPSKSGIALAKEMLGILSNPSEIRNKLYETFDKSVGKAVDNTISSRETVKSDIDVAQFGELPEQVNVSLVVPLYGRFDFIRHQLTHFADDPDFRTVDLIYVVDDPSIVAQALDLAARYHQLFGVPFRMVWYGENRGYAGANNIGARFARGKHLVLLNSDVIPQQPGWLSTLGSALETLPAAGAVGPLLQFGDGAIQHAGMYPRTDVSWPGFILNTHRHMGMAWTGDDRPSQHPMLTAACLMLRTEDFRRVGGFDENYLIGDFEDSDLCLGLRKLGRKLYLVPEAKLWHLERQSQNLDTAPTQRQLVTLFNGWRYSRKIRNGELVDPLTLDISA